MNKTCKTCKYWMIPHESNFTYSVLFPKKRKHLYGLRVCESPKIIYDRDDEFVEDKQVFVLGYTDVGDAALVTAENFGCKNYEAA